MQEGEGGFTQTRFSGAYFQVPLENNAQIQKDSPYTCGICYMNLLTVHSGGTLITVQSPDQWTVLAKKCNFAAM